MTPGTDGCHPGGDTGFALPKDWADQLADVCWRSLDRFRDPHSGLFSRAIQQSGGGWIRQPASIPNSVEVAVALAHTATRGGDLRDFDPPSLVTQITREHLDGLHPKDLACLLWADALCNRQHHARLWAALEGSRVQEETDTATLGWILLGTTRAARLTGDERVQGLADCACQGLLVRQDQSGLFVGTTRRSGMFRRRARRATLAAQVYPVLGLASYAESVPGSMAGEAARACADRILSLQGSRGEWGWTYDVRRGALFEKYPLYSVNHDAAMPWCLSLLAFGGQAVAHRAASERGLSWLFGNNDLGGPLLDIDNGVIFRGLSWGPTGPELIREMSSYHPARCLLALSAVADVGGVPESER